MIFGNQELVKKMNALMLEYADDIIAIERNHVIQFFDGIGISYRNDYIDFLSQFGGNYSKFFQTNEFNCTFSEIKELYLENAIYDPVPPKGYCFFSNQIVDDCYIIENTTGYIYKEGYYDENKYIIGELLYESIDAFLWERLFLTYNEKISIKTIEQLDENNLDSYFRNLDKHKLLSVSGWCQSYFKEGVVYIHYSNHPTIIKHQIDNKILKVLDDKFQKK